MKHYCSYCARLYVSGNPVCCCGGKLSKSLSYAYKCIYAHRGGAKRRKIPFLLTFEEWWAIWRRSGKWHLRGRRPEQYCMARFKDKGAYKVGNVKIITNRENNSEAWKNKTPQQKKQASQLGKASRGISLSQTYRDAVSAGRKGKGCGARGPLSQSHKNAISLGRKKNKSSTSLDYIKT